MIKIETVIITESFVKSAGKIFTDAITILDRIGFRLNGVIFKWYKTIRSIATWGKASKTSSTWSKTGNTSASWNKLSKSNSTWNKQSRSGSSWDKTATPEI
jgi:hypothetical protein